MRLKEWFTVPAEQKVTEKHLRRVLVSSIGSILLCMGCLVGTTWAWFAVSVENTGNEIRIHQPVVALTLDGAAADGGALSLTAAHHVVKVHYTDGRPDVFGKNTTVYVAFSFRDVSDTVYYVTLSPDSENQYQAVELTVQPDRDCTLSWQVLWAAPAGAMEVSGTIPVPSVLQESTTPDEEEPAGEPGDDTTGELGDELFTEPGDEPSVEAEADTTGETDGGVPADSDGAEGTPVE